MQPIVDPLTMLAAAPAAKEVLSQLARAPLHELSELLGDRVRLWRWKNEIRILEEAKAYAAKHGLALKGLPLKTLVPLLEGASMEDDESMQVIWARLIVNASVLDAPIAVATFGAELLRGISHHEARVVEGMIAQLDRGHEATQQNFDAYCTLSGICIPPYNGMYVQRPLLLAQMDHVGLSDTAFSVALDNLARYNVVRIEYLQNLDGKAIGPVCLFTRLGWEAIQLIRAPKSK